MIQILTQSELNDIVKYPDKQGKYRPCGLFLSHEYGKWVACDNSEGDAWTEEFDTLEDAIDWLNGREPEEKSKAEQVSEVQTPKRHESPEPKDPLDAPVTKRDLLTLAWAMYYGNILTQEAFTSLASNMKGESNV